MYDTLQGYIRMMPRQALQMILSREPLIKPSRIIQTRTLLCIRCFRLCADTEYEDPNEGVRAHFRKVGHSFCEY